MIGEGFAYPKLMRFFEEISAIPRASYHECAIADYLEAFAEARHLPCYRDAIHNVLIRLPATAGREAEAAILLQGHVDMVCEKNQGVEHDFSKDPLTLYEQDGWLRAKGTTLGADNGVAVAAMLAILDGALASHPTLECLFTVSEEVGMDGAKAFDYSRIVARTMLNLDSADENSIIVGCMGGLRSCVTLPVLRCAKDAPVWRVTLGGLAGGHSGEDIHRGRANADRLMGRVLAELAEKDEELCLISVDGGTKDNAIPREAEAVVISYSPCFSEWVKQIERDIRAELYADDRGFALSAVRSEPSAWQPMSRACSERVILIMATVANGVFAVRPDQPQTVEFSRNFGVVATEEEAVKMIFSSRSARDAQLDSSARELSAFARQLGGVAEHYNRYPGWLFSETSNIRTVYRAVYGRRYGKQLQTEVIHAGLECGMIKAALPDMDMISCGPTVLNLHSPDEALELASFARFFAVLSEVCERGLG